jgi:membrane-associated two-gene conflict system component 1 (EACC1)
LDRLTIAFDEAPSDADALARSLTDWFNDDEDLSGLAGVHLMPPRPGEMGGLADAVELATAAGPLLAAGVSALGVWLTQRVRNRRVTLSVTRPDGAGMRITADPADVGHLVDRLERFVAGGPVDGGGPAS